MNISALQSRAARARRAPSFRGRLAASRLAAALPLDRLVHHLSLTTFVATGHLLALTLILVVPLYADGANSRLLQETLRTPPDEPRPRNSLMVKHYTSLYGPITSAGFEAADTYLRGDLPAVVGLPTAPTETFVYSDKLRLMPADLAGDLGVDPITWSSLGFDEALFDRIDLVEGRRPAPRPNGDAIEAIVGQSFVNKFGLRPGDRLVLRGGKDQPDTLFNVEITGVWRAKAHPEAEWPLRPIAYEDIFLVPRAVFVKDVAPKMGPSAWYSLTWYAQFPREAITVSLAGRVRVGFAELQARSARLLNGHIEIESPDKYLEDFQVKAATLRILLYIFSLPTLMIVLLYILSTAGLFAERQRAEIAVLKGRGASRTQILGAYLFEGALVDLLPLLLGPLAAFGAAQLIGRSEAFLRFGPANALPIRVTAATAWLALGVVMATLLLGVAPVLVASRQTLISYQQQVARAARKPAWQRLYLDLLVLLAAAYGYYTLRKQGSLVALGGGTLLPGSDPFSNPLSLLLPATALFGCALLAVRCFPALAALLARAGRRIFGATTLLALRHLARSPEQGRSIVLLTVLTLALGSFSASMATTLDRNDVDRILYATGGPLRVSEQAELSRSEQRWTALPPWEHGRVPGVRAWSRVQISDVNTTVGAGAGGAGSLVALDRGGFALAGWWRDDLAGQSLGSLMNILAAEPQALIVSRSFLAASRLRLGDTVTLQAAESGAPASLNFVIRAAVDSFPMVYAKPGQFFFVGNYDYIYLADDPASYDVILKLEPGADPTKVVAGIKQAGFDVQEVDDAGTRIAAAEARPERTGFVGLLSLGFVAATGLTMLALLLYSLFSFRRRMVEIGVLRAAGLSLSQLFWLLAFELCFLTLTSALVGAALGIGAARLFVPFYQLGTTIEARTPPFVVIIAWTEIGRLLLILAGMLALTLVATTLLLRRLRIHEAIKLGQELG